MSSQKDPPARSFSSVVWDEKKEKSDVCLLLLTEKSSEIHPLFVPVVVVGVVVE